MIHDYTKSYISYKIYLKNINKIDLNDSKFEHDFMWLIAERILPRNIIRC